VSVVSQAQQHELPPEEGGGRLNWLLAVLVLVVAVVMGVVLAAGVQSSGVSTQPAASTDPGDGSATADKGEVADLLAHGGRAVSQPAPVPLPPPPEKLPTMVTQRAPHNPSAFEQWAEQKYMRALESPEVVAAFHSSALELPQARTQGGTSNLSSGDPGNSGTVQVHPAPSPYTVTAGNVIPALLVSGIDSDLPGPIVAQVRESVFDSATGRYLLIPQGTKLLGSYQNASAYGQQRVQIAWQRLIFPDASSIDIAGMPGADQSGYTGFSDQIDNHYLRTFGTALLMSTISAGQTVGQIASFGSGTYSPYGYAPPSQWAMSAEAAGAGMSSQLGQVGQQSLQQGMNRAPTLTIRPGYEFNVIVTQDLVLAGPYRG
jgi:type IV secretory pathway VirB10-like protein